MSDDPDTRFPQADAEARASLAAADDARTLLADLNEDGYRFPELDAARCALSAAIEHLKVHRRRLLTLVPGLEEQR